MLSRITSRSKFNAVNTVTKSLIGAMVCCMALHTQAAAEVGDCQIADYKNAVLAAVNAARAQSQACGNAVGAVGWNAQLAKAAELHSHDMAAKNYFDHTSPQGLNMGARARAAGYAYGGVAENIAAGQKAVHEVIATWLASPGHCRNIMNAAYQHMAISCKHNPRAEYQTYWTLTLGHPLK
ncbi:MAG: CAP domain-containing protein [Polaromonas sp.]|nr:CAP domain-containing protein [Polaromonas sp.]MBK7026780.1 CAP domain-containing protein [Polaromonas sp.]MBP6088506.1 CAP domain-containing protein [Polaromonas sp.]MBP6156953.1 CAP domain-containing protein [Polaromonas sp.]MBP7116275.1 CAP domain-containing protein [Polaromonas sp.]